MVKLLYKLLILPVLLTPLFVFAQRPSDFKGLVGIIIDIVSRAIPVIVALIILFFFWGIAQFILHTGGGKEMEEAKQTMLWGIIAIFVAMSVWGIIRLLKTTFLG